MSIFSYSDRQILDQQIGLAFLFPDRSRDWLTPDGRARLIEMLGLSVAAAAALQTLPGTYAHLSDLAAALYNLLF